MEIHDYFVTKLNDDMQEKYGVLDSLVEESKPVKRRKRCGECVNCIQEECGECKACQDKKKFGGNNKLKQACVHRQCTNLQFASGS